MAINCVGAQGVGTLIFVRDMHIFTLEDIGEKTKTVTWLLGYRRPIEANPKLVHEQGDYAAESLVFIFERIPFSSKRIKLRPKRGSANPRQRRHLMSPLQN